MEAAQSAMEKMVSYMFNNCFAGKRVLITGNTGFKGSWLTLWLQSLGAEVIGYALDPETTPSHWNLLELDASHISADVRNEQMLRRVIAVSYTHLTLPTILLV